MKLEIVSSLLNEKSSEYSMAHASESDSKLACTNLVKAAIDLIEPVIAHGKSQTDLVFEIFDAKWKSLTRFYISNELVEFRKIKLSRAEYEKCKGTIQSLDKYFAEQFAYCAGEVVEIDDIVRDLQDKSKRIFRCLSAGEELNQSIAEFFFGLLHERHLEFKTYRDDEY